MNLWMDVMRDLEHLLDNYERLFDAWEAWGCYRASGWLNEFQCSQTGSGEPHSGRSYRSHAYSYL